MPLGPSGAGNNLFDYPRPRYDDLRAIHTDFQPVFQEDEQILAFGLNHAFDQLSFSLIGALRERRVCIASGLHHGRRRSVESNPA